MSVTAEKRRLRAELRERRAALSAPMAAEASDRIVSRVRQLVGGQSLALFWPLLDRREVDLRAIARARFREGQAVLLPYMSKERQGFCYCAGEEELELSPFGFYQPRCADLVDTAPQWVVVPALAATLLGERLGYGAGFYDRALAAWPAQVQSVVVLYDTLIQSTLPTAAHDQRCGWVITETRCHRVSPPA